MHIHIPLFYLFSAYNVKRYFQVSKQRVAQKVYLAADYLVGHAALLFVLTLLIKICHGYFLYSLIGCSSPDVILGPLAVASGDTFSYIPPIINWWENGVYSFTNRWGDIVYAGRMPTYGGIYLVMHLINEKFAMTLLVLLQIVVEVYALVYAARVLSKKFDSSVIGMLFWVFMVVSVNQTFWSLKIQPESFATSLVLILFCRFVALPSTYRHSFVTGILLLILVTLKPYLGALCLIFVVKLFRDLKFRLFVQNAFLLGLPILLFVVSWSIRNYQLTEKFIPLTQYLSGYGYTESEIAMWKLSGDLGLGYEPWDTKSFGHWLTFSASLYEPPAFLKENHSFDELKVLRTEFQNCLNSETYDAETDRQLSSRIQTLHAQYFSDFPYRMKVFAPVFLTYNFVIHSGSWYYPVSIKDRSCGSIVSDIDKLGQSLLYYLSLVLGFLGLVLLARNKDWLIFGYLAGVIFFIIILLTVVLRTIELRFFVQTYPLFVIGMVFFIHRVFNYFAIQKGVRTFKKAQDKVS